MSNKVKTLINNIDKQGYNFFLLFFEKNYSPVCKPVKTKKYYTVC
jgi:hypothetical protein